MAKEIRQEHATAINWLNEFTGISFYLVQVEAYRIGDSSPAPYFKLVCKPDQTMKAIGQDIKDHSDREKFNINFWESMMEKSKSRLPHFSGKKALSLEPKLFSSYDYTGYHLAKTDYRVLSTTASIFDFDFRKDSENESVEIEFEITESGICHAVAYWYELQLDQDTIISTAPHLPQLSCWKQALQLLPQPLPLIKGETFKLTAHDDEALWFTNL